MENHGQATIAHILLSTGKAHGTLLHGKQSDIEQMQLVFQNAIWILYTDKTWLFLPSPALDGSLPISGTYLEIFEYCQFQGIQNSNQDIPASLDGVIVIKEDSVTLEVILIMQLSQQPQAIKVVQELSKASSLPEEGMIRLEQWQVQQSAQNNAKATSSIPDVEEIPPSLSNQNPSIANDLIPNNSLFESTNGGSFHGTWYTDNFGTITLTQSENWVIGHYTANGGGRINGNVVFNRVDFGWQPMPESEQQDRLSGFHWQPDVSKQDTGFGFLRPLGDTMLIGAWQSAEDETPSLARILVAKLVERAAPSIDIFVPTPTHMQNRFQGQELVLQKKYEVAIPLLEEALAGYREALQQEQPDTILRDANLISEARILSLLLECDFMLADERNTTLTEETSPGGIDIYGRLLKHLIEAVTSYRAYLSNTFVPHILRLSAKFNKPYENLHPWQQQIIEQAALLEQHETDISDQRIPRLRALAQLLTPICEHLIQAKDVVVKAGKQNITSVEELVPAFTVLQEHLINVQEQVQKDIQAMKNLEVSWPDKQKEFLRGLMSYLMTLSVEIDGERRLIGQAQNGVEQRLDAVWGSALRLEQWLDRWRVRLVNDPDKIAIQERNQPFFADMIAFLMDMKDEAEALVYSEHARTRAFLDLLEGRDAIREQLHAGFPGTATVPSPISTPPISLEDVQAIARQHSSTLIEYFMTEQKLFIWVISPQGHVHGYSQNVGRQVLATKVQTLLSLLNVNDVSSVHDVYLTNLLRELSVDLIDPLEEYLSSLPTEEVITIIPHETLLQIPFAILQDQHGRSFFEKHALIYASSIATLRYTATNRHNDRRTAPNLLAFINPAPFSDPQLAPLDALQQDFEHICDFYQHKTLYYGSNATKYQLGQEKDYDVLCFATHAQAFSDEPFRSYLALARFEDDDGYLRVPDIFSLTLHTDLVILLACETGKGMPTGDGVIGLSRAFTWAGTSSLLMSLWPIPEKESAYQVYLFHRYWLEEGYTKAHALRMAQLQCMRNYPLQPEVWAAFVLIGDWK